MRIVPGSALPPRAFPLHSPAGLGRVEMNLNPYLATRCGGGEAWLLQKPVSSISRATVTYPTLSLLDEADQRSQIEQSRAVWEQLIGERITRSLLLSAAFTMIGLPNSGLWFRLHLYDRARERPYAKRSHAAFPLRNKKVGGR